MFTRSLESSSIVPNKFFLPIAIFLIPLLLSSFNEVQAQADPVKVLVISSEVKDGRVLAEAASTNVRIVHYDATNTSLEELLHLIRNALKGEKANSIGFVTYDNNKGEFHLTGYHVIKIHHIWEVTRFDNDLREFWRELGTLIDTGGRIDIFASYAGGQNIVDEIAGLSGVTVAGSDDTTGPSSAGGNWILETGNIDLEAVYFTPGQLSNYTDLLTSNAKKIIAAEGDSHDKFGYSTAISGDYLVVSAHSEHSATYEDGAVYIYHRNQGGQNNFGLVKKLIDPNPGVMDDRTHWFGYSIAICGETVIVGSMVHDIAGQIDSGAAFIYSKNQGGADNWGLVKTLTASNAEAYDRFGWSVAISDNYAAVGAPNEDGGGSTRGSVYLFSKNEGGVNNWGEIKKIIASDTADLSYFGKRVVITGDDLIVGAEDQKDIASGWRVGQVYIYSRNQNGPDIWGEVKKLNTYGTKYRNFGRSIALSGEDIIVGERSHALIFSRNLGGSNNWGLVKEIDLQDVSNDADGSVYINGDYAIVKSLKNYSYDVFTTTKSSAYVFHRNQGGNNNWGQIKQFVGFGDEQNEGNSTAITNDFLVVGADVESYNESYGFGAAYIYFFDLPEISNPWSADVIGTRATLGATVNNDGNALVTSKGVVWSTNPDPDLNTNDGKIVIEGEAGTFDVEATSLSPNTTYHYRAFATNLKGTSYTADTTFTTLSDDPPSVDNPTATNVTSSGATLEATVSSANGSAITERGFVWSTYANPDLTTNEGSTVIPGTTGAYSFDLSGLTRVTTYHFRAYATNATGTYYTPNTTFVTLPEKPTVISPTARIIKDISAYLGGTVSNDGGSDIIERGVVWSTSPNPDLTTNEGQISVGSGVGTFERKVEGLSPSTMYHFRAYATNGAGTNYTDDTIFTTADIYSSPSKILASDGTTEDYFGSRLAIDGDYALVGMTDQFDDSHVYIYKRNPDGSNTWTEIQKIQKPPGIEGLFSQSLAISGDIAVIQSSAVNDSGVAWVHHRNQGGTDNWGLVKQLVPSDAPHYSVSCDVAISGDHIVIGAAGTDEFGYNTGSVYIFSRNLGGTDNWGEVKKITASDPSDSAEFGVSVAIDGDLLIAGAMGDGKGSAYIFARNQGGINNWGQVKKIVPSNIGSLSGFGTEVDISGDNIIVGCYDYSGAADLYVFIFSRNAGGKDNWGESTRLHDTEFTGRGKFGYALKISGNTAVIGNIKSSNGVSWDGVVNVYSCNAGGQDQWDLVQQHTVFQSDDYRYVSRETVSFSENFIFIGDPHADDNGEDSGAVHILKLSPTVTVNSATGGTTDKDGNNDVGYGGSITITATPDAGYEFIGWTGDIISNQNPLTIDNVRDFMGITPNFSQGSATLQVNLSDGGSGGSYTIEGPAEFNGGFPISNLTNNFDQSVPVGDYTITFAPQQNYSVELTGTSFTISNNVASGSLVDNQTESISAIYSISELPTISTPTSINITISSATLGATVSDDGGSSITERGVVWSTSVDPDLTTNEGKATTVGTTGIFTVQATGLTPNTIYHFRAYATNSVGTNYTPDTVFTTSALAPPIVTSPMAIEIAVKSATLSSNAESAGDSAVVERGFVLGTSATVNYSVNDKKLIVSGSLGTYFARARNLQPESTYYYRGFARSDAGIGYTPVASFKTAPVNAVPQTVSVTPDSGSGSSQTFATKYADPNSDDDLTLLYFKMNANASAANGVYLKYDTASNKICLRNDANTSWGTAQTVGESGILSNSQVSIDVSKIKIKRTLTTLTVELPLSFKNAFVGSKKIYMYAVDRKKNNSGWNKMGTYTVTEVQNAPEAVSVTPNSGSGGWKTFKALYRDADGVDDLRYAYFKMNADSSSKNAVYLRYTVATQKLDLRNDAGSGWIPGHPIGTDKWIYNGQTSFNFKNVQVTKSETDLTLKLPLRFKASFAGAKNIYMYALDKTRLNSGWQQLGTFTVTATAPASTNSDFVLSGLEVCKGEVIDFDEVAQDVRDAVWFINGKRLSVDDATYRFSRKGIHSVEMFGRDADGEKIVSATDLLVAEELIKAGDLVTWDETQVPIRIRKRDLNAIVLSESVDKERILRLRGVLKPGIRLVFNKTSAQDYHFIELRTDENPDKSRWIYGRAQSGTERILARKTTILSNAEQILTLRLDAKRGTLRLLLNRKPVFSRSQRLRGDRILLIPAYSDGELDIILSKPE